jgi:hypothetical protein
MSQLPIPWITNMNAETVLVRSYDDMSLILVDENGANQADALNQLDSISRRVVLCCRNQHIIFDDGSTTFGVNGVVTYWGGGSLVVLTTDKTSWLFDADVSELQELPARLSRILWAYNNNVAGRLEDGATVVLRHKSGQWEIDRLYDDSGDDSYEEEDDDDLTLEYDDCVIQLKEPIIRELYTSDGHYTMFTTKAERRPIVYNTAAVNASEIDLEWRGGQIVDTYGEYVLVDSGAYDLYHFAYGELTLCVSNIYYPGQPQKKAPR